MSRLMEHIADGDPHVDWCLNFILDRLERFINRLRILKIKADIAVRRHDEDSISVVIKTAVEDVESFECEYLIVPSLFIGLRDAFQVAEAERVADEIMSTILSVMFLQPSKLPLSFYIHR